MYTAEGRLHPAWERFFRELLAMLREGTGGGGGGGGGGGVTDHGDLTGLEDDDHPQYLNSTRADTWLSGKSTTNLAEGANLYFTAERAQDAVGGILDNGAYGNVVFTYDDANNRISAQAPSGGGVTDHGALTGLEDDDHPQYLTESRHDALPGDHVTNGDSHDHNGGDGARIDHKTLSNIGTYSHAEIDAHIDDTHIHIGDRRTAQKTTANLAPGSSYEGTIVLAPSFIVEKIELSSYARVQLYATESKMEADETREIGQMPVSGKPHGVILDFAAVSTPSYLSFVLSPPAVGANQESVPSSAIPIRITNLDSTTQSITVTLTFVPVEA